jgi:gliding motility-associated-like protein
LLDNPASTNPVATLEDSTVFYVTATDSLGCTHTDSVAVGCINVDCGETNIFIPNAFTPNNDGKNDCLCISGEWVDDFHIAIFTRWGEKVYESDNITQCWDGRFRDNWCMPGVYVYYCRIKCANGQLTQLKGDVTLIR